MIQIRQTKCLFMLENQELTDYRMAERVLTGESIIYHEQADRLRKEHNVKKDWQGAEEKLSGIAAADRLIPVVTVVISYGTKDWQGARNLHGLLALDQAPQQIRSLINDYSFHLIDIARFEHLEWLQTDLHETFGFLHYAGDQKKLQAYIEENREAFKNLSEDAYDFIACQSRTGDLEKWKQANQSQEIQNEGGGVDMCKAIDDMKREARLEGELLGREEGKSLGREEGENKMAMLIKNLLTENRQHDIERALSDVLFRKTLYQKYQI